MEKYVTVFKGEIGDGIRIRKEELDKVYYLKTLSITNRM
jgi:hypothetical protein